MHKTLNLAAKQLWPGTGRPEQPAPDQDRIWIPLDEFKLRGPPQFHRHQFPLG